MVDLDVYRNKKVLVTGHTGFKGSWLCRILLNCGANLIGYSLDPPASENLFHLADIEDQMISIAGDIRDFERLKNVFDIYQPEIVFHLAAQPIVRESYLDPRYTYETNVMGTVNICECVRHTDSVKSFLNITTDKVYFNDERKNHPFYENEPLDGFDPYSNSKSCSELVTHSYKRSFFENRSSCAISTARAGNVLGGGDFAKDRIIPDCIRAIKNGVKITVRNPNSTRPYQHVLEPLYVYLEIAEKQFLDERYQGYYNVGPDDCDCVNTGCLVSMFCEKWGNDLKWINLSDGGPHEAAYLKLSNQKIKDVFGWKPKWHIDQCLDEIINWTKIYFKDKSCIPAEMDREIKSFFGK